MNRRIRAAVIALLLAVPAAAQEPLSRQDMVMEAGFQALLFYGWRQSTNLHNTWTRHEANYLGQPLTYPVIYSPGDANPMVKRGASQGALNLTYLLSAVGHYYITTQLKGQDRLYWQTATIGLEAHVIGNNVGAGIRVRW